MKEALTDLTHAIQSGNRKAASEAVQAALDAKVDPSSVLEAMTAGMDDVGRRFKANEIFVPEVLVAARAMKTGMEILEPVLAAAGVKPKYTMVLGTVEGDLHDIGKNLVAMMLRGAHFRVVDLGTNVSPDAFVAAVKEHQPDLLGLSALLTTTMPSMKTTVERIRAESLSVKILIGGAPITREYAEEIGADGYAADAATAVDVARNMVSSG